MKACENLDQYLEAYGGHLAAKTSKCFRPLHVPSRDPPVIAGFKRQPYEAQGHAAAAIGKLWDSGSKAAILCAECGTGKTLVSIVTVHANAKGKPYRALAFVPDHLIAKWKREIEATVDAKIVVIEFWQQVLQLKRGEPTVPTWYVIGRNKAKWLSGWTPSFRKHRTGWLHCPDCNARLEKQEKKGELPLPVTRKMLADKQTYCDCGAALWQYLRQYDRWSPAKYIKMRLKGFFDYLVIDEVHEEKGKGSLQACAAGSLIAACGKVVALTGTLIGGYADNLLYTAFRLMPTSLADEGITWDNSMEFNRRYGRVDTVVTQKEGRSETTANGRGTKQSKSERRKPGVMPTLYGKHLIGNTVFLGLNEVAEGLPGFEEIPVAVELDPEMVPEYRRVEEKLREAVKELVKKGNMRLLGTMLHALLAYPDYPYDWADLGYNEVDEDGLNWVSVVQPANLDRLKVWAKEKELVRTIRKEKALGRQCWVFVQYTQKHPVKERLAQVLRQNGLTVKLMPGTSGKGKVPVVKREKWIQDNAPGVDVIISHPTLVQTGLDFFDMESTYNFPSIIFYETGFDLFSMRQASRRAWRLAQKADCRVYYLYYAETMQERALSLMGEKLKASLSLEGVLDGEEGLQAMAAGGDAIQMELARSLSKNLDFGPAERQWARVTAEGKEVKPRRTLRLRPVLRKPLDKPAKPVIKKHGDIKEMFAKYRSQLRKERVNA